MNMTTEIRNFALQLIASIAIAGVIGAGIFAFAGYTVSGSIV